MDQCDSKIDLVKYIGSVTYISWSIDFALYHCHRLKLFFILYIKKWRRPGSIRVPPGTCSSYYSLLKTAFSYFVDIFGDIYFYGKLFVAE